MWCADGEGGRSLLKLAPLGFLREHGCGEMKGFIISAPMPAAETAACLAERCVEIAVSARRPG